MSNEETIRQDILNIANCLMSITDELYESHGLAFNDVRFRLEGIIKRYEVHGGPEKDPLGGAGNYLENFFNKPLDPVHEINKLVMESKSLRSRNERLEKALLAMMDAGVRLLPFKGSIKIIDSEENADALHDAMELVEQALKENKG